MNDKAENDVLRVLASQGKKLNRELTEAEASTKKADEAIGGAEELLKKLGKPLPERNTSVSRPLPAKLPRLRPWDEILREAQLEEPGELSFAAHRGILWVN